MSMNAPTDRQPSRWQRFLERFAAVDDALNTGYDELQDRRIARLESEVEDLKARLDSNSRPLK